MPPKSRAIVQPINVLFQHIQRQDTVQVWLYDNVETRLEGTLIGFDQFMNIVLDDTSEIWVKSTKKHSSGDKMHLGRLLLKGENITLVQKL